MLLTNAKIYTVDNNDDVIEKGYIRIIDGKIAEIGEGVPSNISNAVDLNGKSIYPGFIDAHTHIGIINDSLGENGEDCNEISNPLTPELRALDGTNGFDKCFFEALCAGVTTTAISPGSANPIGGQIFAAKTKVGIIDNMIIREPVAMKFAFGENPKVTHSERDRQPYTRMGTAASIRSELYKAKRYMDEIDSMPLDEEADEPEYDFKCESLIPLLKNEIDGHFHAHRADDIMTAIRIAKEFSINPVIIHGTDSEIIAEALAEAKIPVLLGPIISERCKPELSAHSVKTAVALEKAGVKFAIITDHPVIPIQFLPLCCSIAIGEGLSENTALRAITANAAEILKIDDRVGSLEVGKDADILVFESNPFIQGAKPIKVILNGEVVLDD